VSNEIKQRYRLFRRGWGTHNCEDTESGKRESLETKGKYHARTLVYRMNEALRQPQVQDQLKKLSAGIFGGPVDKTSAYMREEVDRWAAVIKAANIELQ